MKRIAIAFLLLAMCGCDIPDAWEFVLQVPADTSPERLMEIRNLLEDNGYRRFKICTVDLGRAVIIYATMKERECDERARHIAELGKPKTWSHWCEYALPVITADVFAVSTENPLEDIKNGGVAK